MPALVRSVALLALLSMLAAPALAQSPVGRWVTVDEETGVEKSVVELYLEEGRLFGRVVEILDTDDDAPRDAEGRIICTRCDGEREDQPVVGMVILWDLEEDGGEWEGGRVLDPEKGKTYRAKVWVEDERLQVRGYLGPFYRTQTWRPAG